MEQAVNQELDTTQEQLPESYSFPTPFINSLIGYLVSKPYSEVFDLLKAMGFYMNKQDGNTNVQSTDGTPTP